MKKIEIKKGDLDWEGKIEIDPLSSIHFCTEDPCPEETLQRIEMMKNSFTANYTEKK